MNKLIFDYLKKNNFHTCDNQCTNESREYYSFVIRKGNSNEEFCDERQMALIRAQFGKSYDAIDMMSFTLKEVNSHEWDVTLKWQMKNCTDVYCSTIGGENLYELVSQCIVLADVYDL